MVSEISAKRVAGVLYFLSKEKEYLLKNNPFPEIIEDSLFLRILKDQNFWIPKDLEDRILTKIATIADISGIIFQQGKETFLTHARDLLPTDETELKISEITSRIPILISRMGSVIALEVQNISENESRFLFHYSAPHKEKWYDALFFRGILEGLALLYKLENYSIELTKTRLLGIPTSHSELGPNIQFGSDKNEYIMKWESSEVRVGMSRLEDDTSAQNYMFTLSKMESTGKELSYFNTQSLIDKSRELSQENRDLEAAVEVLKSFKTELEIKQKSIAKDLRLAKNIQKGIIPQFIPDWNGIQFYTYFQPMQEVSGDYYDYFSLNSAKNLALTVCDVSGHGVPAAFITAISKMLFSKYKLKQPSDIFRNVNRELLELLKMQGYTTSFYAIFDQDYRVTYSIAGHPRPILLKFGTNEIKILDGEGTFLGMFPDASEYFMDYSVQLESGDKLFIYSDGIIEAINEGGEEFGIEQLTELIKKTSKLNAQDSSEFIGKALDDFTMGTDQKDDITLIVLEVSPLLSEFEALKAKGDKKYNTRNWDSALDFYKAAHEMMPRELGLMLKLAKTYVNFQKYSEAIEVLELYNSYKSNYYYSHSLLGFCYYKTQNINRAEEEVRKALSMKDDHLPTLFNMAKVYLELGSKEKCILTLNKLLKHNPKYQSAIQLKEKLLSE